MSSTGPGRADAGREVAGRLGADIVIPQAWHELPVEDWQSPIVIVGGTDTGKTTLARYLYQRLLDHGEAPAFIDVDPGQNAFGLPTTVAVGMGAPQPLEPQAARTPAPFPPSHLRRHSFVGSNSPVGHEPRVLAALRTLVQLARGEAATRILVDTSGFIDVAHGAAELKWAKIDLLRPCTVVALQRDRELDPIIEPWQHTGGVDLVVLPASPHVRTRSREARRAYRTGCYRRYFARASRMPLHFGDVALFATSPWSLNQLVALEDAGGCTLALALIAEISEAVVWLTTPWASGEHAITPSPGESRTVAGIRMGDITLNPTTFEDYGP